MCSVISKYAGELLYQISVVPGNIILGVNCWQVEEMLQGHLEASRVFFENAFLSCSVPAFFKKIPSPRFPLKRWIWGISLYSVYIKLGLVI